MNSDQKKRYERIQSQLTTLFPKTTNPLARMASIAALLYHKIPGFSWCGFYLLHDDELVIGPYQGPLACMVLQRDTGVCWAGINEKRSIIVPDVHQFHGHIACDPRTRSEIVVPVFNGQENPIGVLDVDSTRLDHFSETDARGLEQIASLIYAMSDAEQT